MIFCSNVPRLLISVSMNRKLALVCVTMLMASCSVPEKNWTQYGGGPGIKHANQAATESSVSMKWDLGYQRLMSMVWPVSDDTYTYAVVDNPSNSYESMLIKITKETGKTEGEPFMLGEGATFSINVDKGSVVISDGEKLTKYTKKDMKPIWEFQLDDEENVFQIASIEDVIFFVTDKANVYCINKDTGMARWQQKADDRYNYRWCASNGEVSLVEGFIPDGNMKVVAYSTYGGEFLWEFETEGDASIPAQIQGQKVIVNSTGQIVMLDIETGKLIWSSLVRDASGLPTNLTKPGCFMENTYYLVNGNRLLGLDLETGTVIDEAKIPFESPATVMVASKNAIFIALYGDPFMVAYDLSSKTFSKKFEGKRTVIGMAVSDGLVVQSIESLMFFK